jgi:hypothetical protein
MPRAAEEEEAGGDRVQGPDLYNRRCNQVILFQRHHLRQRGEEK